MRIILAALVVAQAGAAALAHTGATGVVMERMMGMSAMQEVVRDLAPMMRGETAYDEAVVRDGAATLVAHSGETMTALFPEGGDMTASYAKPEIWTKWGEFDRLSAELYLYAVGLGIAAPNGLDAPAPRAAQAPPVEASVEAPAQEPPRLTVAQLMGVEPRPDAGPAVAAASGEGGLTSIDFAAMAADDVFELASATCSSCHAQFRSGN